MTELAGLRIILPSITSTLFGCGMRFDTETGLQAVSSAALLILRIDVRCTYRLPGLLVVPEFRRFRDDDNRPEVLGAPLMVGS